MSGVLSAAAIGAGTGLYLNSKNQDSINDASSISQAYGNQALDYQKDVDAMPLFMRNNAQNVLAQWYGLPQYTDPSQRTYSADEQGQLDTISRLKEKIAGDTGGSLKFDGERMSTGAAVTRLKELEDQAKNFGLPQGGGSDGQGGFSGQQGIVDSIEESPYFDFLQNQGAESIGKYASMTGGSRSGNAVEDLARNSQEISMGLTDDYLRGVAGFANPSLNTNAIAGGINNLGGTAADAEIAKANANNQAWGNAGNTLLRGIGDFAANRPSTAADPNANNPNFAGNFDTYGSDTPAPAYDYTLPNNQRLS